MVMTSTFLDAALKQIFIINRKGEINENGQQEYLDSTGYGDTYGVATQMQMYEKIVSTVDEKVLDKDEIKYVIPSGTAIQNARTSYLGEDLTRDGFHLDYGIGRYIVALTYFAVLTGADITELEWAPTGLSKGTDVDAGAYAVAIESVLNALANPYEVTESQYKVAPQE